MRVGFLRFADGLHRLSKWLCIACLAVVFGGMMTVVLLRYGLGVGFIELQDLVTYAFGFLVTFAMPVAMRLDKHVRVDVLRASWPAARNRRVDAAGFVLLLVPVFGLLLWHSGQPVGYAWQILEGSRETGGLPGLFLVKTAVPVTAALMIVQGAALLLGARTDER
ncbi:MULTISPECIES: TRAP transporter small permease subunit [unclassified Roseitalea]|uniref:TRAP transporter small permease subunit n=1 Tax=unclassified Roseitalea TaxID=2639107 RepID=UPI00273E25CB|nr:MULTISPECIES: TRAP transporter small permease subunit [unclassified Roseitalea]